MIDNSNKEDKLILPNSHFVFIWSVFYSLVIFIYFGTAVFQIAFLTPINFMFNKSFISAAVLIFCAADTCIYINIGIILNGKLIKNRSKNIANYFLSYLFIADGVVIVTLGVRILFGLINQERFYIVLSILDLFIIIKFYNIRQYEQILKFYYFSEVSLLVFQFTKHLILLALLCHVVGCAFYLIDVLLLDAGWYPQADHWLVSSLAMPGLYSAPISQRYLYSFYFGIVTLSTVAYGDITPLNPTQVAFVLCILAFLLMFYVYIFAQIYEAVNWFNRRSNEIQQEKYKVANFLKKYNISNQLSGKIVSQFEFRQKQNKKLDKNIFLDDISIKLAKNYNSLPYKNKTNEFMPKFIKRCQIELSTFNEVLAQKFYTPQQQFCPIQFLQDGTVERVMYFIPQDSIIYRHLATGSSRTTEQAKQNNWLGLNFFISGQHDINQKWQPEIPIQLTQIKYYNFIKLVKNSPKCYQKLLQQSHRSLSVGQSLQDKNKCLICWQGYHNSLQCTQYRPQISKKDKTHLLRSFTFVQLRKLIRLHPRLPYRRCHTKPQKSFHLPVLKVPPRQAGVQTDEHGQMQQKIKGKIRKRKAKLLQEETVIDWLYYMPRDNVNQMHLEIMATVAAKILAN